MVEAPALADRPACVAPGSRARLAAARAREAWEHLAACRLCAHRCGVNRLAGETGPCRAGADPRIFHAQAEISDERELAPVFAVAFSGCDLRCDFCNTGRESWDPQAGRPVGEAEGGYAREVAARVRQAAEAGSIRSVMLLGGEPTVNLPAALDFAALLPEQVRWVWKTNGHASAEGRALLDGVFDCWVVDYKFGGDACAERLAKTPRYTAVVRENLRWAAERTDLVVRHLLMPGHLECCWRPVAEWLAAELPGVKVSLRSGFWPGWFSRRHAELRGTTAQAEERAARALAERLGLRLIP